MDVLEDRDVLTELKTFYEELKSYKKLLNLKGRRADKETLRETLVRKVGVLKGVITELTQKQYYTQFGQVREIWNTALSQSGYLPDKLTALGFCIDATNEAIGGLEADIKMCIRDKQGRVIEKPPKATEDYEGRSAPKELELILEGTPDMIIECIMDFVKKLNSEGYAYKCAPKIGDAPDYATWDKTYSASCAISLGNERQIGTIKLRLLPKERTLFKIPEPEDWDSPFGKFISYLLAEFKRLEFVFFEEEKPPLGFKPPHKEKNG